MKRTENIFFLAVAVALVFRIVIAPRDASAWAAIFGLVLMVALYYARAFIPADPSKDALVAIKKEIEVMKNEVQRLSVKVGFSR